MKKLMIVPIVALGLLFTTNVNAQDKKMTKEEAKAEAKVEKAQAKADQEIAEAEAKAKEKAVLQYLQEHR